MAINMENCVKLRDRVVWFDGSSTVTERQLAVMVREHCDLTGIFVDKMSNTVEKFNACVPDNKQLKVKTQLREIRTEWTIPDYYQQLVPQEHVYDLMYTYCEKNNYFNEGKVNEIGHLVLKRTTEELRLFKQYDQINLLKALIYVINTFRQNNVVWFGRGSSVSSFVLFLIGVHDIDSFLYDLPIDDFFHH